MAVEAYRADTWPAPVAEIEPFELLEAVRRYDTTGRTEAAHRVLQFSSQVFRYAIANQLAKSDPTRDLRVALVAHKSKHHAAILESKEAGELLRAIDGYDGSPFVRIALQLSALLFVRSGELRHAEWAEIDTDKAVWRIHGEKMKDRLEHVVPLPQNRGQYCRPIYRHARALGSRQSERLWTANDHPAGIHSVPNRFAIGLRQPGPSCPLKRAPCAASGSLSMMATAVTLASAAVSRRAMRAGP